MIRKANKKETEVRQNMRGGAGSVGVSPLIPGEQLPKGYRMLSELCLEKGCGIGVHTHENESEVFYVLSGEAIYNDNGEENFVAAGDVCVCYAGESHCVRNEKDETVRLLAVIITQ